MKKIWCGLLLLLVMVGCSEKPDYYVCKYDQNNQQSTMSIEYGEDRKLLAIEITTIQKVSDLLLEELDVSDFETYWEQNAKAIEMDGVKVTASYDEALQQAKLTIKIDVNKLEASEYAIFFIPENSNIDAFLKQVIKQGYVCNN